MSLIDDFLEFLGLWRDRGAITFDADEIVAPHASVRAFDHASFAADAQRFTRAGAAMSDAVEELQSRGLSSSIWSGDGGQAAQAAADQARASVASAFGALVGRSAELNAAQAVLGTVIGEYRTSMALVVEPLAAGLAVAETTEALDSRLELAARTGAAASKAVDEALGVLADQWRSAGELVTAGNR